MKPVKIVQLKNNENVNQGSTSGIEEQGMGMTMVESIELSDLVMPGWRGVTNYPRVYRAWNLFAARESGLSFGPGEIRGPYESCLGRYLLGSLIL